MIYHSIYYKSKLIINIIKLKNLLKLQNKLIIIYFANIKIT